VTQDLASIDSEFESDTIVLEDNHDNNWLAFEGASSQFSQLFDFDQLLTHDVIQDLARPNRRFSVYQRLNNFEKAQRIQRKHNKTLDTKSERRSEFKSGK
jgi:Ser/Thr protein kinase RdoA (MazF antagonist)